MVYFKIQSSDQPGDGTARGNLQSVTTTPQTVAVGLHPEHDAPGQRGWRGVADRAPDHHAGRRSFVQDPNPALAMAPNGSPLTNPIKNQIPQIQVREMESVLQLVSGQTAVLGGLMQDDLQRNRDQIPGLGNIPRVGRPVPFRNDKVQKSELVIFLRPIVVKNPSLDSEELKHLRKFLPRIDQTGQNP